MKILYLSFIAILFFPGCSNTSYKYWTYTPNSYPNQIINSNKTISILIFKDCRKNEKKDHSFLSIFPLIPYSKYSISKFENINIFDTLNYNLIIDFPKALVEDISLSHYFQNVNFNVESDSIDFIIKGKIINTDYESTLITYGITIFGGVFLAILGFPFEIITYDLCVELSLIDNRDQKEIYRKKYTSPTLKFNSSFFSKNNKNFDPQYGSYNYPKMLAGIYKEFIKDIKPIIREYE